MRLTIYSRTLFLKNLMLFILLSFMFVYFVENFNHPKFFSGFGLLSQYIKANYILGGITLFLVFSIFFVIRWSKYLFFIFSMGIFIHSVRLYFQNNVPAILPLSLVYMMCSYYFFSLFNEELKGAVYNPNYESHDINPVINKKLKVLLRWREKTLVGYLVNWDSNNAFIFMETDTKLRGRVSMEMLLDKSNFYFEGRVVTAYNGGYGIKIIKADDGKNLGWSELYQVLVDRGYNILTKEL